MMEEVTAAYVGIGDELLSGSTRDTNFFYLARSLKELGIRLVRGAVIPDDLDAIRETLNLYRHRVTYVFTSGGLGPTHDDVTVDGVAGALGVQVLRNPVLESKLRETFGDRLDESSLKMAEVPEGAVLHFCDQLLIPVLSVENIYLFPGIPELFEKKLDSIKERFRSMPFFTAEILCDRFESEIVDTLMDTLKRFPSIKIGSYPQRKGKSYQVKIVVEGREQKDVERAGDHLRNILSKNG
jgi:molybdenum cofactor synthesis domain-containing protein